ncbi:MAG: DUF3995 domain-containing protein [Proteobacteria bacterium]|nr:DUF3995 domain-containing protein [Pseudomonadota bacterium]
MTALAWTLTVVVALLAAAHAWWGMGRIWPASNEKALAHAVIGDGRDRLPPPWQCWAVAVALAIVAAWPWLMVTWRDSQLVLIGGIIIGAIFFIRGSAGYSPRWRGRFNARPFRGLDHYLYSPLCLALGVGFVALLSREMN